MVVPLKSHDVIAAIDVNSFAGDAGAAGREKEGGGGADFASVHVAAERRAFGVPLEHVAESGNATGGERFEWTGGDSVDTNILGAQVAGEITNAGFERGFRYAHDVVFGNDFFRAEVAERDDSATFGHERRGGARDGDERIDADVVGNAKAFARGIDEFVFEIFGVGESNAVHEAMQRSVTRFELVEERGDLFIARDITHETG